MAPTVTFTTPRSDGEWDQWRSIFTQLYMDENYPLPKVMKIMEEEHHVRASTKMYKNKVKDWGLSKYLKADKAQQILDGTIPANEVVHDRTLTVDHQDAVKRAERSLKRKRARERTQSHLPPIAPETMVMAEPESYSESPVTPGTRTMNPWGAPEQLNKIPAVPPLSEAGEQFLINLRKWTHDAFLSGQWDTKDPAKHHSGRQASRSLSTDLTAGTQMFKKGKEDLAWTYWNRAVANFDNPDLFKTWYYETPIRLLFEMSRLVHEKQDRLAASLLSFIKDWAIQYLDKKDSRRALFSVFGDLHVAELRNLYDRAARSLFSGMESRLDKNSPLLYEIRLNRALDLLWYDDNADLTEWIPEMEEVDKACGPLSPVAIYFLLLQAYRLVAQESYDKADEVSTEARTRLAATAEGNGKPIDHWRVGLAYRRLGKVQQSKQRYKDARRSFNTAVRYLGTGNRVSGAILIDICQFQLSMAKEMDDPEDAALWEHMLGQLEQQAKDQEEADAKQQKQFIEAAEEGKQAPPILQTLEEQEPAAQVNGDGQTPGYERSPSPLGSFKRTNTL